MRGWRWVVFRVAILSWALASCRSGFFYSRAYGMVLCDSVAVVHVRCRSGCRRRSLAVLMVCCVLLFIWGRLFMRDSEGSVSALGALDSLTYGAAGASAFLAPVWGHTISLVRLCLPCASLLHRLCEGGCFPSASAHIHPPPVLSSVVGRPPIRLSASSLTLCYPPPGHWAVYPLAHFFHRLPVRTSIP